MPVKIAQAEANQLQSRANVAQQWASTANTQSNTARAWGNLYEKLGRMPHEFALVAEKYDSARADAKVTSVMSDFSKKYSDPSKKYFTPEELEADGIEFDRDDIDLAGNKVPRTQIPKHEIYAKAYEAYATKATSAAKNEFGFVSYSNQWELKNQMAMDKGIAQSTQQQGQMAVDFLTDELSNEVKGYMDQSKYGAAMQALEGCESVNSPSKCNLMRLEVTQGKQIGNVQDAMASNDVKRMNHQLNVLLSGNYNISKEERFRLIEQLRSRIKTQTQVNTTQNNQNYANDFLNKYYGSMPNSALRAQIRNQVKDAKLRKELVSQLNTRISEDEQANQADRMNIFDSARKEIEDGSKVIPAYVTNSKDIYALNKLVEAKKNKRSIQTNPNTYRYLKTMMNNDPKAFEKESLHEYYGDLSDTDRVLFEEAQNAIKEEKQTPIISTTKRVEKRLQTVLGDSFTKLGDDDKARYIALEKNITDALLRARKDNPNLTSQQEDEIISGYLAESVEERSWYLPNSTTDVKDFDAAYHTEIGELSAKYGFNVDVNIMSALEDIEMKAAVLDSMQRRNIPINETNIRKAIQTLKQKYKGQFK